MTPEMTQIQHVDDIVAFMTKVNEKTARPLALELWKYYPEETLYLCAALAQTQHTRQIPRLLQRQERED